MHDYVFFFMETKLYCIFDTANKVHFISSPMQHRDELVIWTRFEGEGWIGSEFRCKSIITLVFQQNKDALLLYRDGILFWRRWRRTGRDYVTLSTVSPCCPPRWDYPTLSWDKIYSLQLEVSTPYMLPNVGSTRKKTTISRRALALECVVIIHRYVGDYL